MARPKKLSGDQKTVNVRMSPEDWSSMNSIAQTMGMTRSEMLRRIAQGKITLGQPENREKLLLGKS